MTLLKSHFFGVFYKEKVYFKEIVNRALFKNNTIFAKEYFSFFWGNMHSADVSKSRAGHIGFILGSLGYFGMVYALFSIDFFKISIFSLGG
jgi:hypothetical protein